MAERIARRLSASETPQSQTGGEPSSAMSDGELASLRTHLAQLQERLAHLEAHVSHEPTGEHRHDSSNAAARRESRAPAPSTSPQAPTRSTWLSGTYVPVTEAHPSEERFGIQEAVSELVDFFEREKICSVEPGEKPCDHCAMCSSRGF